MTNRDLPDAIALLKSWRPSWKAPVDNAFHPGTADTPFAALVSCILSLRTRDETTGPIARRLLERVHTPEDLLEIPEEDLAALIYPVGFYRRKAAQLRKIAADLLARFEGEVPSDIDLLTTLPGVGRKTANIVLVRGFGLPGIPVDTHVHRICNRWGYLETRTPDETEKVLRQRLPKVYWIEFNSLLVAFGQTICRPVSPKCERCPVSQYCDSAGV